MSDHEQQHSDIQAALQRIQQQLQFLEKKLDTLIQQSQQKPSFNRGFSKPFRPFGNRPNRPGQGHFGHGGGNREGGRPDGPPRQGGNFAPKKKFFGNRDRH